MTKYQLLHGDCLNKLKELEDNSVDAIVTDPPYGLSFMGKKWDYDVPSQEIWDECFRVLKQGGHLLSFSGSRTYHRMAVRIEDAGFEIRDQIMWIYGSGFPKSLNISKQIDKKPNANLKKFSKALKERRIELGLSLTQADKLITGGTTMYSFLEGRKHNDVYPPNKEYWEKIKEHFGMDEWSSIVENNLKVVGEKEGSFGYQKDGERWEETRTLTQTTTDLAKKWEGWGTALKPAHEPIVMARKPFKGSVADNVLEWGTGGINIDDSRIQHDEPVKTTTRTEKGNVFNDKNSGLRNNPSNMASADPKGRFPANVIFDEEAVKILDEQSGISKSTGGTKPVGGASRFFYCAKANKKDRNEGLDEFEEKPRSDANKMMGKSGNFKTGSGNDRTTEFKNNHPTVKPTNLMAYLVRLVTPKGGVVLDPFMGSGSTGKACAVEGMQFIGIEREQEYLDIAKARIERAYNPTNPKLF